MSLESTRDQNLTFNKKSPNCLRVQDTAADIMLT